MRLSKQWIAEIFGGPKNPLEAWKRDAEIADRLEKVVSSGHLEILWDEILAPMDQEAYEAFTKLDPTDSNSVTQIQKVSQVIADIRKRVTRKIELGRLARQKLKEFMEDQ